MKKSLPAATAALLLMGVTGLAGLAMAQEPVKKLSCDGGGSNGRRQRACDLREQSAPVSARLEVNASPNGSVRVQGWQRNEILVRARVEAWATTESEAKSLLSRINVNTAGGRISADGPDRRGGDEMSWSVSYEVFIPVKTDLTASSVNGGINIDSVSGAIEFKTTNGGVNLSGLNGKVTGRTTNGGVNIQLDGDRWNGELLDVSTTNGGVSLTMPSNYSAKLEAGTVNGGFHSDVPVAVQGSNIWSKKEVSATLGSGGAPIKVRTTNGGIHIKRKG